MDATVYLVDAFTTEIGRGNRAGVVLNAAELNDMQMQAIAAYVGASETAFVLPQEDTVAAPGKAGGLGALLSGALGDDAADMRVRFFTPMVEVPICGHATVATHFLRATLAGAVDAVNIAMDTGVGRIPVLVGKGASGRIEVTMMQAEPQLGRTLDMADRAAIAAALRIPVQAIRTGLPVQYASTGSQVVIVPLADAETLHGMQPDFAALAALAPRLGCPMLYVFAEAAPEAPFRIDGRIFCPAEGIDEDPVTGMANGPAGLYLASHGLLPDEETVSFVARQGHAMGREGYVEVTVYRCNESVVAVQIAGTAVVAGTMNLHVTQDGAVAVV